MSFDTRELQEESAQDELWLISYADMLTLLVGFFVLIIASVPMKRANFERIAAALSEKARLPRGPARQGGRADRAHAGAEGQGADAG